MNHNPRIIAVSTGTILRVFAIALALAVAWLIRDIILYVFIAFLLAGMLYPLTAWAERHKIPKALAVISIYILLFGIIALLFTLILPPLIEETKTIATAYGTSTVWLTNIINIIKDAADRFGLTANLINSLLGVQAQLQNGQGLLGTLMDAFSAVAGMLLVLVLSFYIILEEEAVKKFFKDIVPKSYQEVMVNIIFQITYKLGEWMRGQLLLSLIMGVLYLAAFLAIGVPYPVLLALLGGVLEFVPYLGPILAGIPVVLLALTISPLHALIAVVAMLVFNQLENNLIVPKVMQEAIGMNPIVSILAFVIGAQLFGVLGALFAIPVATAMTLVWTELLNFQRRRHLF